MVFHRTFIYTYRYHLNSHFHGICLLYLSQANNVINILVLVCVNIFAILEVIDWIIYCYDFSGSQEKYCLFVYIYVYGKNKKFFFRKKSLTAVLFSFSFLIKIKSWIDFGRERNLSGLWYKLFIDTKFWWNYERLINDNKNWIRRFFWSKTSGWMFQYKSEFKFGNCISIKKKTYFPLKTVKKALNSIVHH